MTPSISSLPSRLSSKEFNRSLPTIIGKINSLMSVIVLWKHTETLDPTNTSSSNRHWIAQHIISDLSQVNIILHALLRAPEKPETHINEYDQIRIRLSTQVSLIEVSDIPFANLMKNLPHLKLEPATVS